MKDLTFRAPLQLAVAENATTPAGLLGAEIWSTTANKKLVWDGSKWAAAMGGGGAGSPGGTTREIQFNDGGAFAGAANVEIDNGDLSIVANATPTTPPAGSVKLFGKILGNTRVLPAAVGPSGMDYTLQPAIWRQKVGNFNPSTAAAPGVFGASFTIVGTLTVRTLASTSLFTRMRRLGYVSAATAGSLFSMRNAAAQFSTGNGSGVGGFFQSVRFAVTDAAAVSGARMFMGVSSATGAPTNVEPNTLTNSIGVGQLSTDSTQLYLFYGGSAAQTPVALGTGFPCIPASAGINNGIPYDFMIWCPPSANGVVHWQLDRLDTGTSVGGTITPGTPGTQTPANTTMLNTVLWRCNNATAAAVGVDIINIYTETDY